MVRKCQCSKTLVKPPMVRKWVSSQVTLFLEKDPKNISFEIELIYPTGKQTQSQVNSMVFACRMSQSVCGVELW